jgi:CheY-like chemotaxis protein
MARKALPVFAWDQRSLSMKELTPAEAEDVLRVRHQAGAPYFHALVADDDDDDRMLTIRQLGAAWPVAEGLTVECAADGVEALEKISHGQHALVVLDWDMPEQDGEAVLKAIRANGLRVPVVVVSGQRRENIRSDLTALAATFVNKNELDADRFRSAIQDSLQLQAVQSPTGSKSKPNGAATEA